MIGSFSTSNQLSMPISLVSGTSDTDNASFSIEGNKLKIKESPNYEIKSEYSFKITTNR